MSRATAPMTPREDIQRIKAALADPRALCQQLGLLRGHRRQPRGVLVFCPAHDDGATPACSVTLGPDGTLRVRCFACPLSGDVFDLIAAVERVDRNAQFQAVLRRASELATLPSTAHPSAPSTPSPLPLPDADFASLVAPLLHVGRLDDSDIARDVSDYLRGRGILALAQREGWAALPPLGPSQRSWVHMLVDVFGEAPVRRSGLVNRDLSGFVYPESRLVIPWRDPEGRVYTLQRRRLDNEKPKYVMPAGRPAKMPYGIHNYQLVVTRPSDLTYPDDNYVRPDASQIKPVAFVEGAIDSVAFGALAERWGRPMVALGLPGAQSWDGSWASLVRDRLAIVAVDANRAGEEVVARMAKDLNKAIATRVLRWAPKATGDDWADILLKEPM